MKIFIFSYVIIFASDSFVHIWVALGDEWPRLTVVSHHFEVQKLYLRMRDRKLLGPAPHTSLDIKKRICEEITTSEYFKLIGKISVDVNLIHEELKTKYPVILSTLYESFKSSQDKESKLFYHYRTKIINIALFKRTVTDYVFVCLARDHSTEELEEYYISEPYNVNELSNGVGKYIAGHFIFKYDQKKNAFILHSFGEESAKVLKPKKNLKSSSEGTFPIPQDNIETLYLQIRSHKFATELVSEDPLCKLSDFNKMRVCAAVLSSSYFDGNIKKFKRTTNYVASECQKRDISFRTQAASIQIERAKEENRWIWPEEWMLLCVAEHVSGWFNPSLYISRAYSSNAVFVYVQHSGDGLQRGVYLQNESVNLSVIVEE